MTDHQYILYEDIEDQDIQDTDTVSNKDETLALIPKEADELLIDLVKSYTHLYNEQSKDYKDQIMKTNTWREIAQIMNTTESECQNRWIRLREKYAREKKKITCIPSGAEAGYKTQWPYFSKLEFLEKHITSRRRISNAKMKIHSSNENSQSSTDVIDILQMENRESLPIESSRAGIKKRKFDAIDSSFIELSNAIKSHLSQSQDDDSDGLLCKFISAELKKKKNKKKAPTNFQFNMFFRRLKKTCIFQYCYIEVNNK